MKFQLYAAFLLICGMTVSAAPVPSGNVELVVRDFEPEVGRGYCSAGNCD